MVAITTDTSRRVPRPLGPLHRSRRGNAQPPGYTAAWIGGRPASSRIHLRGSGPRGVISAARACRARAGAGALPPVPRVVARGSACAARVVARRSGHRDRGDGRAPRVVARGSTRVATVPRSCTPVIAASSRRPAVPSSRRAVAPSHCSCDGKQIRAWAAGRNGFRRAEQLPARGTTSDARNCNQGRATGQAPLRRRCGRRGERRSTPLNAAQRRCTRRAQAP